MGKSNFVHQSREGTLKAAMIIVSAIRLKPCYPATMNMNILKRSTVKRSTGLKNNFLCYAAGIFDSLFRLLFLPERNGV